MDATRLDLGQMSEQVGEHLVRATDQTAGAGEQVVVRDMFEPIGGLGARRCSARGLATNRCGFWVRRGVCHVAMIHPRFSTSFEARSRRQT